MKLFAIGDLHMPGGDDKPMDVFGDHWERHVERIFANWRERVREEDTVLIPGDLSWAMQLPAALPDLQAIGALPGRKIICKGNHDYWWSSITQVRASLPEGMFALQHDAVEIEDAVICGSRGWTFPGDGCSQSPDDAKVLARELIRMEMSIQAGIKLNPEKPLVVMMHYPPLYDQLRDTPFTHLFERYPVHTVVYGHLHGAAVHAGVNGVWNGVRYRLTSCDALKFVLDEVPLDQGDQTLETAAETKMK